jgi:hypothetical protein
MREPNKYVETSHVPFISTEHKHRSGTALAAQMREIMGEEQAWAMTFNAELKTPAVVLLRIRSQQITTR